MMIAIPFTIPDLNAFAPYLKRYKGTDLSFLKGKITRTIDQWAMPYHYNAVDDRELELVYGVPSRAVALSIAEKVISTPEMTLRGRGELSEYKAKLVYEGITWDDFEQGINLTVRFYMEPGAIAFVKSTGDFIELIKTDNPYYFASPLEWGIHVPTPPSPLREELSFSWAIGGEAFSGSLEEGTVRVNDSSFNGMTLNTADLNKSVISGKSLASALQQGIITFEGNIRPDASMYPGATEIMFDMNSRFHHEVEWSFGDRRLIL